LGGEKIDVVEWNDDPEKFIANALAPAKVLEVKIDKKNTAKVSVPEDQLSLAIGKDGRNVRLAANLTGWKIDIEGVAEVGAGDKESENKEEKKDEEKESKKGKKEEKSKKEKTPKKSLATARDSTGQAKKANS